MKRTGKMRSKKEEKRKKDNSEELKDEEEEVHTDMGKRRDKRHLTPIQDAEY